MTQRITTKLIQSRLDTLLNLMGNAGATYNGNKARIGAWYLDYAPCYGGYSLNEIVNEGGGVRVVNGWCNRMTGKEMLAFITGMTTVYQTKIVTAE